MIRKETGLLIQGTPFFFLKASDFIGQKEPFFAFIAVGGCEVMKVFTQLSVK
jgi:hypothetical protein